MSSLNRIQEQIKAWTEHNFPDATSEQPLVGVMEELGELSHAWLKGRQGIRHTPEQIASMKKDAVGDLLIYLTHFCILEGITLQECYDLAYAEICKRDFQKDKMINNDEMQEITSLPPIVSGLTQAELDQALGSKPPFGYRKFDTYPQHLPIDKWCEHCSHEQKDHIIIPHIDGDVLNCIRCNCRRQLAQDDHWCIWCKHPVSIHKNNIDVAVCECGCIAKLRFDPSTEATVDQGTE